MYLRVYFSLFLCNQERFIDPIGWRACLLFLGFLQVSVQLVFSRDKNVYRNRAAGGGASHLFKRKVFSRVSCCCCLFNALFFCNKDRITQCFCFVAAVATATPILMIFIQVYILKAKFVFVFRFSSFCWCVFCVLLFRCFIYCQKKNSLLIEY